MGPAVVARQELASFITSIEKEVENLYDNISLVAIQGKKALNLTISNAIDEQVVSNQSKNKDLLHSITGITRKAKDILLNPNLREEAAQDFPNLNK